MKTIGMIISFFLVQTFAFAQQEDISNALETGNVDKISQYFEDNIELTILTSEGIYSKAQARVILKNFFDANTPAKFTIQHQGGTEISKYVIGTLTTNQKSYRVYFLIKKINNKSIIQKIRIEND